MKIAEDAEKYQWHDLRKNPDDLPEDGCEVLAKVACANCSPGYYVICRVNGMWLFVVGTVIAWKYIEPFEEEERWLI